MDPTPLHDDDGPEVPGLLAAAFLGLVEGATEFLPISSTGHLIVAGHLVDFSDPAFKIAIQVGAITAILFLYRRPLWQAAVNLLSRSESGTGVTNLWVLILIATLPAALAGLFLDDLVSRWLFKPSVVAVACLR